MLSRLPFRPADEHGFTMTELLVVIGILGVLAAIAVPTLLQERNKGTDVVAKAAASSGNRALVIYGQDHETFACGDSAACLVELRKIEPALPGGLTFTRSGGAPGDPTTRGYRVTARGGQTRDFWLDRPPGQSVQSGCAVNGSPSRGGCRDSNDW